MLLLAPVVSGCAVFSRDDSVTDYQATKRAIDEPADKYGDGVFRPEGESAEKVESDGIFQTIGLAASRRKDKEVAREQYAEADQFFNEAKQLTGDERIDKFRDAAKLYKTAGKNWRSSGLEQDSLLMAAESHFFAEDYYQAEQLYASLLKEYPRNRYLDHVDTRRFEIADYWLKIDAEDHKPFYVPNLFDPKEPWNDTGGHGKRVLDKLRIDNPTGKISDDATMRIAMEHFEKSDFEMAAQTFEDLRLTYPDSDHLFDAQFLEIQCLLASYQGAEYSSIPLTEAQKRVKQITRQFPVESDGKREELNEAYAKIRYYMAERVWKQATYRRNRGENGAAKFHYNRLVQEFSETPFAEEARGEIGEVADAPENPPQRFKSLVWLFGADTNKRPWIK